MALRTRLSLLGRTALVGAVGVAVLALSAVAGGLLGAALFVAVALVLQVSLTAFVLVPALVAVGAPLMSALRDLPAGWLELYGLFAAVGVVVGAAVATRQGRRALRRRYGDLERGRSSGPVVERVERTVEGLARQASVAVPAVRVVDADAPLTYTLPGDDRPTVVVARDAVARLDDRELEAVLAHELAHVANGDLRTVPAATLPLVTVREVREKSLAARPWGVLLWATLPVVARLSRAAVGAFSRGRELAADDGAAAITGDPAALASALERLHAAGPPETDLRAARAVGVVSLVGDPDVASHPPVEHRVARLRRRARDTTD